MARTIVIDGVEHEVDDGITLLQACEQVGIDIPRFCYHERLSIAGNCRMCLIEVVGVPKPVASCAMGVRDLRPGRDGAPPAINTRTEMVKRAREGVMEFLLINHPLDCPICDQGGECDLQDQAMAFGVGGTRYEENKRAVDEKHLGPLIKTAMTRCIQCTRCVRFMTEVAGVEELGAIGRGEDMEITTYLEKGMMSELSANVVDLCPVGALTHRPWAHNARPWELRKTESIDVMDAMGAAIRVDTRGREVMRILPRNNDDINEEWISDKTRHVVDGLKTQRIDQPYVRKDGRLEPVSWDEALATVAENISAAAPQKIGAIAGDLAGGEEMFALKELMQALGSNHYDCRPDGTALHPKFGRASYLFNATIAGIDKADAIMIVGTDLRHDAPLINARIRKRWLQGDMLLGMIGGEPNLGYDYTYLGDGSEALAKFAAHAPAEKQHPMIIIGQAALTGADGEAVLALAAKAAQSLGIIKDGWNGFSVLHTAAARVTGLDLGFVPQEDAMSARQMMAGGLDVIYNLGVDEHDIAPGPFVIYQGSHGDRGAHRADVVLPGSAYTEKSATYVNTEGRAQMTSQAVFPPGQAKEDWKIIRAISEKLGKTLPYDTLTGLRSKMYELVAHFAAIGEIKPGKAEDIASLASIAGATTSQSFEAGSRDFYLTNPIARSSRVMAELSALRDASQKKAAAAE